MNIKELMIGNIIQDEKGNYFRVDGLADDRVRTTADGVRWYMPVIFSGIPITEEILKKCGFEKIGMSYLKGYLLINEFEGDIFSFVLYGGTVQVENLHQLQNLYFSITNKELEVNL